MRRTLELAWPGPSISPRYRLPAWEGPQAISYSRFSPDQAPTRRRLHLRTHLRWRAHPQQLSSFEGPGEGDAAGLPEDDPERSEGRLRPRLARYKETREIAERRPAWLYLRPTRCGLHGCATPAEIPAILKCSPPIPTLRRAIAPGASQRAGSCFAGATLCGAGRGLAVTGGKRPKARGSE